MTVTPADHDGPYKRLFSHPQMVADLIRGFLGDEFAASVDYSTLTKGSGSYIAADLRERCDDVIWHVRWRSQSTGQASGQVDGQAGQAESQPADQLMVVYLLLEFQSTTDRLMPVRIMEYVALLYQDLAKSAPEQGFPAILPVVLYNGEVPWRVPTDIGTAIGLMPPGLERYRPHVPYLLLDETRLSLHHRDEVRNLASALFALEQAPDTLKMELTGSAISAWLETIPELTELRRDFALFFTHSLTARVENPPPNPFEGTTMIAERVQKWIDGYVATGEARGFVRSICDMVTSGDITRERAVARLQHLVEQQQITNEQAEQAIRTLG